MTESTLIIVFAPSSSERDFLRSILSGNGRRILYFENEAICFDNLKSIAPQAILIRTDARAVAWRFIFALQVLQLDARLVILSDCLTDDHFNLQGLSVTVLCFPMTVQQGMLGRGIQQCIWRQSDFSPIFQTELFVGETPAILNINAKLQSLAHSFDPVLITGECGTGKELLARLIVQYTNQNSTFIRLDCEKIRTGGFAEKISSIDGISATCGLTQEESSIVSSVNILLHNINRLDEAAQSEILMLLDRGTGRMTPSGSIPGAGIRVIATSEVDLFRMVESGSFRLDLYYRLNVIPLHLPPLRERKQDISLLMDYFIISACAKMNRSFLISPDWNRSQMVAYGWPGNLDELKRAMERFARSGDQEQAFAQIPAPNHLSQLLEMEIVPDSVEIQSCFAVADPLSLKSICDQFAGRTEKKLIQKALESTNWNRKKAAALLNISYKSILNKMRIYEIV